MILSLIALYTSLHSAPSYHDAAPHIRIIESQQSQKLSLEEASGILNPLPWTGHFSATTFRNTTEDRLDLLHIKRTIRKALQLLPYDHSSVLDNLEVRNKEHVSRGMANHEKIILHTQSIDNDDELIAVFIHELGHVVDLGMLQGQHGKATPFHDHTQSVLSDDPSYHFYRLSWIDNQTHKPNITKNDFVSGYAQTNPFEDFAESYLLYRMHGEKFRSKMKNSAILRQKYDFLKRFVFEGREFQTQSDTEIVSFPHVWDVTLLPLQS